VELVCGIHNFQERNVKNTLSNPWRFIPENGKEASVTDSEFKYGPIALAMKENGKKTALTEKENSYTSMETFMKECGPTIKPTDKESINMSMELCIKVNGRKISSMEKEQRPGLMIHAIKVITLSAASTVLELINGTINLNIPETGAKIKSVELVSIHG
jgi:hypothetical protein